VTVALRLRIEHGTDAGRTVRLSTPGRYRFGRVPASSLQIVDMKVSKEHFEIWIGNGSGDPAGILDLESSHGTWVNAQRVVGPLRPLSPGDEIRIGMTVLRVLSDGPADAEAPAVGPAPSTSEWASAKAARGGNGAAGGGAAPDAPAGPPRKAQPPDALTGKTLGGYRILERVGSGGMGAVYKAEQLSLHREVALKVLAERLVSDSAFVDQFVNEARAAGALNHPNVVQVYDVGQADGRHYFSMEYIHGGSLEDRLGTGPAPWEEALGWFQDAASALVFAEKKGILHRDIKPDNLMVSQDGTVKLCDLGLAKKSESADLLAQGIIGTPHFIAPEAIRRKVDVDRRADLYSLGCACYRILTAKNPFPAPSVKEILLAHLNQPPPRVSAGASDVPRELDDVVLRLMQKDPAARFQSAEDLWEALEKIRLQHGLAAHGLHPGRAKKVALAVVAVALVVVGAAAYVVITQKPDVIEIIRDGGGGGPAPIVEDPEAVEVARQTKALAEFNASRTAALESMGRLEDGDNWKKPGWAKHVEDLRALAEAYPRTEAAQEATKMAAYIEGVVAKRKAGAAALDAARSKARGEAQAAVAKARQEVQGHLPASRFAEAEAAAAAAEKTVAEADARRHEDQPVVSKDEVAAWKKETQELLATVSQAESAAWEKASLEGAAGRAEGTLEGLERARVAYRAFLALPAPAEEAEGAVARTLRDHRAKAEAELDGVEDEFRLARAGAYAEDRKIFQDLVLAFYDGVLIAEKPRNLYARFKFGDALRLATEARAKTKTPEYVALVDEHVLAPARLLDLCGRLARAGAWADKVSPPATPAGPAPWEGQAKVEEVHPEGIQVARRFRYYKDLGIPWFLANAVHGPNRQPRVPLSADDHEALGTLAEAGIVRGDDSLLAAAKEHWRLASEADPARAERLARRGREAEAEAAAQKRLAEGLTKVKEVNDSMDAVDADVIGPAKFENEGREGVKSLQAEWTTKLVDARKILDDVLARFESTKTVAVTAEKPPPRATYGGEERPPEPPPTPPPPPPDAVPSTPAPPPEGTEPPTPPDDGAAVPAGEKPPPAPPGPREPPPPAGQPE
jgi:hypothetical protein